MTSPFSQLASRLAPTTSDGVLLDRYCREQDEAAFAALVHRHGPMVLGVCRRLLGRSHDADDAFQAVFLVLVRRAPALTGRTTVGDWLHGVAVRVALQARVSFARRRKHERAATEARSEFTSDPAATESWLDRELAALPAKFREPAVLCLIQERSRAEVATELGIPEGTLASRLDTARKRLAERLARYREPLIITGLTIPLPAALADAAVNRAADSTSPISLLASQVTTAMTPMPKWPFLLAAGVLLTALGSLVLAAPEPRPRPVARKAPVPEQKVPKWKQEFDEIYMLKDDELVKIIPRAERPDCRREFVRDRLLNYEGIQQEHLETAIKNWEQVFSYIFEIDSKGKRGHIWSAGSIQSVPADGPPKQLGTNIFGVTYYLARIERYEIESDPQVFDLTFMDMPDFLVRSDAPREKFIPALDKALHEKLNARFKLEWKELEREVWVASGEVKIQPRAWRKDGQVDVYSDEEVVDKSADGPKTDRPRKYMGGTPLLLAELRRNLQTWVLWEEGDPPAEPKFTWRYHWREVETMKEQQADRDPEKVLANVGEQTGITFKKVKRKVPVLVVSERK